MSLEGAKFICIDEAGNHGEIVLAKGRKFTMGYYVSSDYVLVDERAKGVHCEIECDAFGRVSNIHILFFFNNEFTFYSHFILIVFFMVSLIHFIFCFLGNHSQFVTR